MKNYTKIILILLSLIFAFNHCWADSGKPKNLTAIEFLTGFGLAKLQEQGNYNVIPVMVDFDFDLKPWLEKKNINPRGLFQFIIEPFIAYVSQPRQNAEIGSNLLIKIGFLPGSAKLQPYFKAGVGLIYSTQHFREEGTQLNFNGLAGLGAHYFFKKNTALTLEYRFRHVSNADTKRPNTGIATNFVICGISYYF